LTIVAFAGAANAQSVKGKVTLPYEVHWGTAILPAGEYFIMMDSLHTVTMIQSANTSQSFYTRVPVIADGTKDPACLLITSFQGERRVRSLNLPEYGRSLVYEPFTKAERERVAKAGQVQVVPVIIAKK
jgi:hypothetical protein